MILINIILKLIFCSPRTAIAQLDNQNTKIIIQYQYHAIYIRLIVHHHDYNTRPQLGVLTEENTSQKLNDKVPSMPKLRQLH